MNKILKDLGLEELSQYGWFFTCIFTEIIFFCNWSVWCTLWHCS